MPRKYEKQGQQPGRPKAEDTALYPPVGTPEPPVGDLGWPVSLTEVPLEWPVDWLDVEPGLTEGVWQVLPPCPEPAPLMASSALENVQGVASGSKRVAQHQKNGAAPKIALRKGKQA